MVDWHKCLSRQLSALLGTCIPSISVARHHNYNLYMSFTKYFYLKMTETEN